MPNSALAATSPPAGVSNSTLAADFPLLLPLLAAHPTLLIYTPTSPSFVTVSQIYNTSVSKRPGAIVRPKSEAEAAAVVSHCAATALPLAVRTGGHDMWGRSVQAAGVQLDMRSMDSVMVRPDRRTAVVGGGILSGELARRLECQGLSTPTGFCTGVGYAGWATGGGYGVLQGTYGLGVDQIVGARVATPDRGLVDTDADPELLWAVRGAGTGLFGAVVQLRVRVYEIPKMLAGNIVFPLFQGEKVLRGLAELCKVNLPDAFSADFLVVQLPQVGPAMLLLFSWVQRHGSLDAARSHLEKIYGLGTVLLNTVDDTTPFAFASTLDPVTRTPQHNHFRSVNVERITPQLAHILAHHPPPNERSTVIGHYAHGQALNMPSDVAFATREPHVVLGISGGAVANTSSSDAAWQATIKWSDGLVEAIRAAGLALEQQYMSFSPPEECDTNRIFGGRATRKLREVKLRYDAGNVLSLAYPQLL